MADIEIFRSRYFGYIRPVTVAGKRFVEQTWPKDERIADGMVQFNVDYFEDIVEGIKEIAEGLDIEVR